MTKHPADCWCIKCCPEPAGQQESLCRETEPEQPSTNAMIFEQIDGAIKVAVELLEQLETKDTNQETQKNGCIWTLKGWWDNLKHLQKAFE